MKIAYLLIFLAVAATGCATTPVPVNSALPAPRERILAFQDIPAGPSGTIVVTRDKGLGGSGCYYGFSINNVLAARLAVSETASFRVAPGELVLRSSRDPYGKGLCGAFQDEWTQRETILRNGETKHFRLSIDRNGKTDILRADPVVTN